MQIDPTPRQRVRRSERLKNEWLRDDEQVLDQAVGAEALTPGAVPAPIPSPEPSIPRAAGPAAIPAKVIPGPEASAISAEKAAAWPMEAIQPSRYAAPAPLPPKGAPASRAGYAAPRPMPERRSAAPMPPRSQASAAPYAAARPAVQEPRPHRRAAEAVRTEVASRPEPAPRAQSQEERFPRWLSVSIGLLAALCLVLLTSQVWMSVYLQNQAQARADAHQALLDAHPLAYQSFITRYAAEYNLQPAFVSSIILNESSYRPSAESNVGARGLMQLMPATAEWIAGKLHISNYSFDQLWDAETNIRFGCWYLNYLAERFDGDPVAVTAAYHAGQGQVSSWLNDRSMSPDGRTLQVGSMIEGPTKVYAGRVTKHYAIYDALYFHTFNHLPDASAAAR